MVATRSPASINAAASRLRAAACVTLLLVSFQAPAIDEILLRSGPVRGPGWSIAETEARVRLDGDGGPVAVIEVSGIELPPPFKQINRVTASCFRLEFKNDGVVCAGGELRIRAAEGAPLFSPARIEGTFGGNKYRFRLMGLELGGGKIEAAFEGSQAGFSLTVSGRSVPLPELGRLLDLDHFAAGLAAQTGLVSGKLSWRSSSAQGALSASLELSKLSFSDASGLNAGENLEAALSLNASHGGGPWRFASNASLAAGQIYLHPVFIDAAEGAIRFDSSGIVPRDSKRISVNDFSYRHQGIVELTGSAELGFDGPKLRVDRLLLDTKQTALSRLHEVYIKPWLLQTVLSKLEVKGDATAYLDWSRQGASEARLTFRQADLQDQAERFAVQGLDGVLEWRSAGTPPPTQLRFDSAQFYRIAIGAAELSGALMGSEFSLGAPLELPMLEGGLHIQEFQASGLGGDRLSWRMRGGLKPISLAALASRFGWPQFSGSLSGEVPSLRYADGEIAVDGKLNVRVFDGQVEINELKLRQPFGVVPRMTADVAVENLSLSALTSAFSFGRIEGRLSGSIDDLVLENWRPAAFDARFATPKNDRSRHRISQRAVENLARIGGAGQVLSSTLLSFLDSFSYDRLGISCRLKNGVCEMGGVEKAERGYYIVKGGGLPPRIDVFGFNTRVDWSTLVARLKAITRANEAVIQ